MSRQRIHKSSTSSTSVASQMMSESAMCSSLRARFSVSALMLTLVTIISLASLPAISAQNMCPSMCQCIWRNGKQTAVCDSQGLISIPSGISPATQVLSLNKNNFQILPNRVFQERGLINLQKAFLAECKLGVVAPDTFLQLTNLVELDLSSNLLTRIPTDSLEHVPNVRRLQLNGNPIQAVTRDSLSPLANIESLELSNCQIDVIEPGALRGLSKLQYLKLDGNRLSTLSSLVVNDLPPLFLLDLHRNPWHCDCELRPAREWMLRYNVPQNVPPTCEGPEKLAGTMWNSLELDSFACAPVIITRDTEVSAFAGFNASFSCTVRAQPEAKVSWLVDDVVHRNLSSALVIRGERFSFVEDRSAGPTILSTTLTIANLELTDSGKTFICSAENSAGTTTKNFTITVQPISAHPSYAGGWSKAEVVGGVAGLLLFLGIGLVFVAYCLMRSRRHNSSNGKAPLPQIDVLKNISSPVGVIKANGCEKVIGGVDGKGMRPEMGAPGFGSNGVTPDLTSSRSGVPEMMTLNGYVGHDASGYMMHTQMQNMEYAMDGGSGLLQQVPGLQVSHEHLKSPYNYLPQTANGANNYENYDICDAYNNYSDPSLVNDHYNGLAGGYYPAEQAYPMGVVGEPYWSGKRTPLVPNTPQSSEPQLQGHQSYVNQGALDSPHGSSHHLVQQQQHQASGSASSGATSAGHVNLVGQGNYNVAHPTVVRYSPDEGYAEEPANTATYTLEGTEV